MEYLKLFDSNNEYNKEKPFLTEPSISLLKGDTDISCRYAAKELPIDKLYMLFEVSYHKKKITFTLSSETKNEYIVDWGDGNIETLSSDIGITVFNHTYNQTKTSENIVIVDIKNPCIFYSKNSSTNNVSKNLKKINFGNKVVEIGPYTFNECKKLEKIVFNDDIEVLNTQCFYACNSLKNIVLPKNLKTIGKFIFSECDSLKEIFIPNSVITFNNNAFIMNDNLERFIGKFVSNDKRALINNNKMLSFAPAGLTSYTIPNEVKEIADDVFSYNTSLTSITLPDSVTTIGNNVFSHCISLCNIVIPNSVTKIGANSFNNCISLSSITIPENIKVIYNGTFYNCTSMKYYDFTKHTSIPSLSYEVFMNIPPTCEIRVPSNLLDEWRNATNWCQYASNIVGV